VAEKTRAMRNCGQRAKNVHELMPFNHRLDNLQAAILRVKLRYLDQWLTNRRNLALHYNKLLQNSTVITPVEPPDSEHVYHLYVIRSENRDALQAHLKEYGIGTAIHYPNPVHLQPFYANSRDRHGEAPVAEQICNEILSLPMYPEMTEEQVEIVASTIKEFSIDKEVAHVL
jgi:dTDP-4-amino-4,6-dideoxygalactose transaminase